MSPRVSPSFSVLVEARGVMAEDSGTSARAAVEDLTREIDEPIRDARVKLTHFAETDGAVRPAVAQANLDVAGLQLRAQSAADSVPEAVRQLHARLRDRVSRLLPTLRRRYRGMPSSAPREWPYTACLDCGDDDWQTPARADIARRKPVALRYETVDEAAFHMDTMDYDCYLFADAHTGQDSLIFRAGPTGYRLVQLSTRYGPPPRRRLPVTVSPEPARHLTIDQAFARLRTTRMPFIFFADAGTADARGAVLYQRYDGRQGLLTPFVKGT